MVKKRSLTTDEIEFCKNVENAILVNQFGDKRKEIDFKIAGIPYDESIDESFEKATDEVSLRIKHLEKRGIASISDVEKKHAKLLKTLYLFDFFHLFLDDFDLFILEQLDHTENIIVNFSDKAFEYLKDKGFTDEEARHNFALSFQIRRAFYFIDRNLIGQSESMKEFRKNLWHNVFTSDLNLYNDYLWNRMEDFSTLILGDTGTGKGTAAMAIGMSGYIPFDDKKHRFYENFINSFISINLSQYSESLIESELFGHKKGAFTGAVGEHKGVFEKCSSYGSIFLDEIGDVSTPIQIKLLKVLEERIYSPVGSHTPMRFKGRIIGATNKNIDKLLSKGLMRDDFYYRLSSDIIQVPNLSQRIKESSSELDDMVDFAVYKIVGKSSRELCRKVKTSILNGVGKSYNWPGNVRELAQAVRRILLKKSYEGRLTLNNNKTSELSQKMESGVIDAISLTKGYCFMLYERFGTYGEVARRTKLDRRTVKKYVDEWEKEVLK
jgi:transcriptional regulator with AAA-type ATPase domain